ncbi:MAG: hypothetical protein Q7K54_05705 [Candidatus Parcubacteria bacterium]|nr:hypothetical protein [Candidatus Parcubacteria bacterium]
MTTIKQERALEKIVENRGNIGKSMIEAGYSENSAKNPKNLTESKGWKELINQKIKDSKLVDVLNEGLKALKGGEPDYAVRHKYLVTGLDLKGYLKQGNQTAIQINLDKFNEYVNEDREEFR